MKLVLELKNKPKKGDVLVFDGKNFECVSSESFLRGLNSELRLLKNRVIILTDDVNGLKEEIKILKGEE